MTPKALFVFAALWCLVGVWGFFTSNLVFGFGGLVLAIGLAVHGIVMLRRRRRSA
ncbi:MULTISPECIES: hypothetical protein [unclassified Rathayibacter]|uniref:hypothetical protein n=1 Tax=unclassified Rathayibacter TaxID=2609250 RepID=UPI0015E1D09D|nr:MULTISPECIES: hypothetical protein [unclassified Rathayibacter]